MRKFSFRFRALWNPRAFVSNVIIAIQSSRAWIIYTRQWFSLLSHRVCYFEFFMSFFAPCSRTISILIIFHVFNASSRLSSDLVDDAELFSLMSKLRFKVRNGSLLKVVAPRCETPTLIFRAVAFQHFILVLYNLAISSSPNSTMLSVLLARCFNLFSLPFLFFYGYFQHSDWFHGAPDFKKFTLFIWYIISMVRASGSCYHHGPLKI